MRTSAATSASGQVVVAITPEFLAGLHAGLAQAEAVTTVLPTIDAADRRSFRLQASADEGFKVKLQAIIGQRAESSFIGLQAETVDSLAVAAETLAGEADRVRALLTRLEDAATLVSRELVLHLRVAKSAFGVVSGRSASDLKEQLAQAGSRFTGRRKRKPKVAPVPSGTPVVTPTVAAEKNHG